MTRVSSLDLVDAVLAGQTRAIARMLSRAESAAVEARAALDLLYQRTGRAHVVGITGVPGSGKSTLVAKLAAQFRASGRKVGIIAVDPSSPFSGGAILGDRIRMGEVTGDPGVFVRSMATRGALGGLARATADVATVLDASGKDIVLIETVGVGQDEIDIVRLADVTIVILVPGMGDDVQTIKAGIMEIADVFVINKSDSEGAERVEREIRMMQTLAIRSDQWTPPIVKTVATEGTGLPELVKAIADYQAYLAKNDLAMKHKVQNWRERLTDEQVTRYAQEIAEHKRDPYTLVEEIVKGL